MALSKAARAIISNGDRLFVNRLPLLTHWQELAANFYYERATFTVEHSVGEDFADGTYTSRPALYRREMGDMYRPMMRPVDFFEIQTLDEDLNKQSDARAWLQHATEFERKMMYRRGAGFDRATVLADHDHVTFGNGVIEAAPTPDRNGIFYRNWHLRDVAWSEDYAGNIDEVHRSCRPTLAQLVQTFKDKVPERLRKGASENPQTTIKARHSVVPRGSYDFDKKFKEDHAFVSLWVLPEEEEELETVSRPFRGYIIPRALMIDGSQYARSPLTGIVLPDARSMQVINRILQEAGEKAVDPPMLARLDSFRSDMGLYAGGYTWLDNEYDERNGDPLRPLKTDYGSLPFGADLSEIFETSIREGLKTTKITLPETGDKTAYEIRKIIEQHMRAQVPLFGPIETEYNEPLCAETFSIMRWLGAFPAAEIPESLRNQEIEFSFKTPIKDLEGDNKRQMLGEGIEALGGIANFDQNVALLPQGMTVAKDILRDLGWPEEWIKDERMVAQAVQHAQEQRQAQAAAQTAMEAAEGAGKAAPALKALADVGRAA